MVKMKRILLSKTVVLFLTLYAFMVISISTNHTQIYARSSNTAQQNNLFQGQRHIQQRLSTDAAGLTLATKSIADPKDKCIYLCSLLST